MIDKVLSPLSSPSRCWGPMAVDSSMRTPLIRTRIPPTREPTADVADLFAWSGTDLHVREDGARYKSRLGASLQPWPRVFRRRFRLLLGRAGGKSRADQLGIEQRLYGKSAGRQYGRQGSPVSAIARSALFATVTTDASCGAVNGMHDSFTPIGGLVPLFNIQTDEVIFGGVGAGLYSMLIYAVIAVFIGGLMVGRTPEYVGKKIEQKEVKMAIIAILATSLVILGFTAPQFSSAVAKNGYWNSPGPAAANTNNSGAHGFSEILYAYSSGAGNNGSAFAGINANTPWYNLTIGIDMLVGSFFFISRLWQLPAAWPARNSSR